VGTGRPQSFQSVAENIAKEYNAVIEYIPMPENVKGQYQAYTCADTTKLKKHYSI
jgi:ADP-L-glycero-D-manno-heptose 6-epimerase